jgi:uncharacterized repeat protein (TIGR01451 family)
MSISVTDGMDSIVPGGTDTYSITLTNNGPSAATNAMVTDTLNGGFVAMVAVSPLSGTTFSQLGTDQFEWSGINLAAGASATFILGGNAATTLEAGGALVNLVTGTLPVGEVDTDLSTNAVDADTVLAAPQSIAFTPPASGIAGQSATLAATGGGSGNPVVFSVDPSSGSGVCNVTGTNGTTLDYTAAGTCVVDANQEGNASYAAAPTVTASIMVEQVPVFSSTTPPTSVPEGQAYTYTFAASGTPAPAYSFAPGAPTWLAIDGSTGAVSGMPPTGTSSFSYAVEAGNSAGTATVGPFTVTVAQSPPSRSRDADVSASLSCPSVVPVRATASCTLTVLNGGPATARFVTASIALPFRFARATATGGAFWFGNVGTWFLGSLQPGSSETFAVSFRASTPGRGTVLAAALAENPDPNYANNVVRAQLQVTPS